MQCAAVIRAVAHSDMGTNLATKRKFTMEEKKSFFEMVEATTSGAIMKTLKENKSAEIALALAKGESDETELAELEKAASKVEDIIEAYNTISEARNALLAYGAKQVYNNRRTTAITYLARRLPEAEFKIYLKEIIARFSVVKNDDGTFITRSNARALKYNASNRRFFMPKQAKKLLSEMEKIHGWKECLERPYGSDKFKPAERGQGQFDVIIENAAKSLFKALIKKSKDSSGSRISGDYAAVLEDLAKIVYADDGDDGGENQDYDDIKAVFVNYKK